MNFQLLYAAWTACVALVALPIYPMFAVNLCHNVLQCMHSTAPGHMADVHMTPYENSNHLQQTDEYGDDGRCSYVYSRYSAVLVRLAVIVCRAM